MTESGQAVTAWVPASHLPERGEVVPVRYVRSDPTVVGLQGDERPYGGRWRWRVLLFGSVTLALLTCVGFYRWAMRRFYDLD